jgi:hypothetical protein
VGRKETVGEKGWRNCTRVVERRDNGEEEDGESVQRRERIEEGRRME